MLKASRKIGPKIPSFTRWYLYQKFSSQIIATNDRSSVSIVTHAHETSVS